ncbi:hypothetical protein SUGI_0428520 [Cryptomeria japonica]|nr:hypothetical protein SUGI_0428520 [Cryptomeria japonica]
MKHHHSDMISTVSLNSLLHSGDRCSLQILQNNYLMFSKTASFDGDSQFLNSMLREYALALKAVIFVLDEFDHFISGKQRVLCNPLDSMQFVLSQVFIMWSSMTIEVNENSQVSMEWRRML